MSPGARGRPTRLRFDDGERTLSLGVHQLLEVAPRRGDLRLSVAWGARQRMAAGQELHQRWAAERGRIDSAFAAEYTVQRRILVRGWEVSLSGRLDGLSQEGEHWVVEELKSSTLPGPALSQVRLADLPDWALQLQLYLYLLATGEVGGLRLERDRLVGRLVLCSLLDGSQRVLSVPADPGTGPWLLGLLDALIAEREERIDWAARRRGAPVPFPHAELRPGQAELLAAAEAALAAGDTLLVEAPTGHGKTAAALTAALRRAAITGQRVFFATMRTTQQRMAEQTLAALAAAGLPLRAVTLRAREKVCLNDHLACQPEACRFSRGFYDKVKAERLVRRAFGAEPEPRAPALQGTPAGLPSPEAVQELGAAAEVCPHGLAQELMRQADVVIGDMNHVFDPASRSAELWAEADNWLVVVDEAHHLPDRAMGYGSPTLSLALVDAALRADPPDSAPHRPFRAAAEDLRLWLEAGLRAGDPAEPLRASPVEDGLSAREVRALAERFEALALDRALLWAALDGLGRPDPWVELARALLRLRAALERAGPETLCLWRRAAEEGAAPGLSLFCRDPSRVLGPAFAELGGAVCMSATLSPARFYVDLLGLEPARAPALRLASPFLPEQLRVLVCPQVSTEHKRRARDRAATAALISEAALAVPGNVAVFFPSFQFLDDVAPLLQLGIRPVLRQRPDLEDEGRAAMLAALRGGGRQVLLAVLGGSFAEGVDLPGDALLGAIIVGPGLPPVTPERRLLEAWYEERFGEGRRYAWLVPGLSRVVQAAGRVVRRPEDRGAVVLIGRRFLLDEIRALLPADWSPLRAPRPAGPLRAHWPERGGLDALLGALALPAPPADGGGGLG